MLLRTGVEETLLHSRQCEIQLANDIFEPIPDREVFSCLSVRFWSGKGAALSHRLRPNFEKSFFQMLL